MQRQGVILKESDISKFPARSTTQSWGLCNTCEALKAELVRCLCQHDKIKEDPLSTYISLSYVWHFSYPKASKLKRSRCVLCRFLRESILRRIASVGKSMYRHHPRGSLRLGYSISSHIQRLEGHLMLSGQLTAARTRFHRKINTHGICWDVYSSDGKRY